MKILTLNTWGKNGPTERRSVLVQAILDLAPDVACLQEVTDPALLEAFANYPVRLHAPQAGLAILSRFPVSSSRTFTYSAVSPLEPYRRQLFLAELSCAAGPLWLGNTHLAWRAEDEPTRLAQVEQLLYWGASLSFLSGRVPHRGASLKPTVLLAGDFNAAPDQAPIARIREGGFTDLFGQLHPNEAGITWDNANPYIQSHAVRFPDRRIDFLFLRQDPAGPFKPVQCEVACRQPSAAGGHPSDHYGVLATLLP